ncbi:Glycosyltransferase involved in cell wall bisynthesis [Prevotella aff. ruminicola Tc2-24]|uniref:Glycosyltransferase involved in cell wall bisynthesis n=1 Tax=Prevotella aff. ruminicola Tc2-24 TaxID=81582 RepID=A0A1I0NSL5_9BACT|nr:glycosyltransferase [Prevotella aff. ruminicola Tc2-24]SEW04576.1 Glycosyltransferase involved in cell wall bisynthesis [Prevotella aff. ruminicola Tc2-24]
MGKSKSHEKRSVFFLMSIAGIGGTGKAFVNLLSVFPFDRYEVHLGLFEGQGALMKYIPQDIQIHTLPALSNIETVRSMLRSFRWFDAFLFLLSWAYGKITHDNYWFCRNKYRHAPRLDECYDLAIAFRSIPSEFVWYLCHRIQAKKKCIWIHEDLSMPRERFKYKIVERLHQNIDHAVAVSEEAKIRFDEAFPQMKQKTLVIRNVIPVGEILEKANAGSTFCDAYQGRRLLTVGRLQPQKGILLAIRVLRILLDKHHDVKWYIIGGEVGNKYYRQCMKLAQQEKVTNHLVFLGEQENPYRFMKDCDIYVQPSLYESFCITLGEALCFGNPIVCTDFCGVEQMSGRTNGYITDFTPEAIAEGIEQALKAEMVQVSPNQQVVDISRLYDEPRE